MRRLLRERRRASAALAQVGADILVLAEDNVAQESPAWVAAAHRRGIAAVVVPYTVANPREFLLGAARDARSHVRTLFDRAVARVLPTWVAHHLGRRVLRLPAEEIVALVLTGMAPRDPWMLDAGQADALAVDSEVAANRYIESGVPEQLVRVTGRVAHDLIASGVGAADVPRVWHGARRRVLFALPPEVPPEPGATEYTTYGDLLQWLGATMGGLPDAGVVVSLHPRADADLARRLLPSTLVISSTDIARLIGACDVFVASLSATIAWAIAAGRPVIDLDVGGWELHDYLGVPGVQYVTTRVGFEGALTRLVSDDHEYDRQRHAIQAVAKRWGVIDGQAVARLVALFEELVASRGQSAGSGPDGPSDRDARPDR